MKATALLMAVACVAIVSGQNPGQNKQPDPIKQAATVSVT